MIYSASLASMDRRDPTLACRTHWSGCRARRSRPTSRLVARARPAFSRGCPRPSFITRSEEHTSELQSLMRISYAVFCLKKKKPKNKLKTSDKHYRAQDTPTQYSETL